MKRNTIETLTVWIAYILGTLVVSFLRVVDFGTLGYWLVLLGGSVGFSMLLSFSHRRGVDE